MNTTPGDELRIRGLQLDTVIGVHAWERRVRQRLLLDITLPTDAARGAAQDALADAIDYDRLATRLREAAAVTEFQLIESLAEHLAAVLLHEFDLPWVRLELAKPGAIAQAEPVRLRIERRRPAQA